MSSASKVTTAATKPKSVAKPKAVKSAASEPAPEPVPAPVLAPVSEPESEHVASAEISTATLSSNLLAKFTLIANLQTSAKNDWKVLEKRYSREVKLAEKLLSKKSKKRVRVPIIGADGVEIPDKSGFKKPTLISSELAAFLDLPVGTLMARTSATKEITKYVHAHSLLRESNKRYIEVHKDAKLQALLRVPKEVDLSYFNLQKFMTVHFAKKDDDAFVKAYVVA